MYYIITIASLFFTFISDLDLPSKYTCRTGQLHIETSNRFMDVVADNYQVYSELNPTSGEVSFKGLMKSFEFKMGALDQAFNSNRLDLSQYSKFTFNGNIINRSQINFGSPGEYSVVVDGFLYIGSFKRKTSARGTIKVLDNGRLDTYADFSIRIEEESMNTINKLMKEKLPSVVALDTEKLGISRDISISLKANYRPRN